MKKEKDSFVLNRIKSISFAFKGLWLLLKSEKSIKTQIAISILMTICGFVFNITHQEWMIQILCIGIVLVAESLNTAIEKIANFVHPDFHEKIGVIKDVAAGAVAFAAIIAIVEGLLIYIPKLVA
ncbi:diacylglycerol kinase family protein [Flavicella marina]|uniref:diacylglycerol kinase family protein n=1 Tax=Flavicella marina TaxID=1475951 RepID=UPI001265046B|nr:diacylglycerol kinase family protein [Flavicella marina]